MTFEQWWQTNYESGFATVTGAMKLAFKEVAEKAWIEGYNKGFNFKKILCPVCDGPNVDDNGDGTFSCNSCEMVHKESEMIYQ